MSSKINIARKLVEPDPLYNSRLVTLLVGKVLKSGKKTLAYRIVYDALYTIEAKTGEDPLSMLEKAVKRVTPKVGVRVRRKGRRVRRFPVRVRVAAGTHLALRWIVEFSRARVGKSMSLKLSDEILAALKGAGGSVKRKRASHKVAKANKFRTSWFLKW
jgi:small subunit ribosomal protein S7